MPSLRLGNTSVVPRRKECLPRPCTRSSRAAAVRWRWQRAIQAELGLRGRVDAREHRRALSFHLSQMEVPMAAPDLWFDQLCSALLSGASKEQAVDQASAAGDRRESIEMAATGIVTSPLFAVAQRMWVQLACREWMLGVTGSLAARGGDQELVDRVEDVSRATFVDDYYSRNRALFLPAVARQWPAISRWTPEYLKRRCGREIVEVMQGRLSAPVRDQASADYLKRRMAFSEYIDLVLSSGPGNDLYMVARNRFFAFGQAAELLSDFDPLPFVNTRSDLSDVKLWFGPAGTYTPLHYDPRNNLLVQIFGSKEIRLYSPRCSRFMAQRIPGYAGRDPEAHISEVDSQAVDSPRGAIFRLDPGDALFIPVGWWHAVKAESVSASLNFHDFGLPNRWDFPTARVVSGGAAPAVV
jgi:hypothetical protein